MTPDELTSATTKGPLIGRDRELARLEKTWARAQSGNLTTPGVVFRGEAGIGKSRLVAAAIELADQTGGVVLELNGSSFHTDVGLHPLRALIESRCGIERITDADDGSGCWPPKYAQWDSIPPRRSRSWRGWSAFRPSRGIGRSSPKAAHCTT
jgi:AAA ATPase domain